jgi:hypothetical protein
MDKLDELRLVGREHSRETVLICSQPLHLPAWSQPYATAWYEFLTSVVADERFGRSMRIRLHPAEQNSPEVPADVRANQSDSGLREDLQWASHVVSPFSTVLIDALAASRSIASISADPTFAEHVQHVPFFSDPKLPKGRWNLESVVPSAIPDMATLREKYLVKVGSSGQYVAEKLMDAASAVPS